MYIAYCISIIDGIEVLMSFWLHYFHNKRFKVVIIINLPKKIFNIFLTLKIT